jgi:nucleotide-binding universal stress UspA family protein
MRREDGGHDNTPEGIGMRPSRIPRGFRLLLCPVDFSAHARRALRYAAALAQDSAGRLVVLFVQDPLLLAAAAKIHTEQTFASTVDMELRRFVATSLAHTGFAPQSIDYRVAGGAPAATIEATACALRCDLIVMGTHGLGGMKRLFFGSTTRAAYCPISQPSRRIDLRVSSRGATVIIEEPAESLSTANAIGAVDQRCTAKEFVAEPLVIPFGVVMLDVLGDGSPEMTVAERDLPIETLFP